MVTMEGKDDEAAWLAEAAGGWNVKQAGWGVPLVLLFMIHFINTNKRPLQCVVSLQLLEYWSPFTHVNISFIF